MEGQFSNSTLSVPLVQTARSMEQQATQAASAHDLVAHDLAARDLAAIGLFSLIGLLAAFLLMQAFPVSPWVATSIAQLF